MDRWVIYAVSDEGMQQLRSQLPFYEEDRQRLAWVYSSYFMSPPYDGGNGFHATIMRRMFSTGIAIVTSTVSRNHEHDEKLARMCIAKWLYRVVHKYPVNTYVIGRTRDGQSGYRVACLSQLFRADPEQIFVRLNCRQSIFIETIPDNVISSIGTLIYERE